MNGYGYKLKKLREGKDLTRTELAEKLNLSTSAISMYETEERKPRDETKILLADFFEVDVSEIFFNR